MKYTNKKNYEWNNFLFMDEITKNKNYEWNPHEWNVFGWNI